MQVRAGGVAGAADISDLLTPDYLLPGFDLYCAQVSIYRLQVIAVVYNNAIAETPPIYPADITVPASHTSTFVPVGKAISSP